MSDYDKPRPPISTISRPFWDGLAEGRLTMPRCGSCEEIWHPPTPYCPACWSDDITWTELSGRATVNSWVVFHQSYFRGFADDVPYNVAEVALEEGPRLLTNIVAADGGDDVEITVGMAVEIVYDDVAEDLTLAKFRPAASS